MYLKSAVKRIFFSVVILFLLITFLFFLIRFAPGNPADKFVSPKLSAEFSNRVENLYGLNKPVLFQYLDFVKNLSSGTFGISYNYRMPVESVILQFLPFTIFLAAVSLILQLIISSATAVYTSKRLGSRMDKIFSSVSLILYAVPAFFTGVFLIYIFSVHLNILPSSGLHSFGNEEMSFVERVLDYAAHLVLPLITLSLSGTAMFYKYLRDEIELNYKKSFATFLRSHGYTEKTILYKHILPNSAGPLISVAGVELGFLLGGAVITEVIFGLPGMGRLTLDAVLSRDYPLVIGATFTAGLLVIIANLIADLFRAYTDKRTLDAGLLT